ncbi:MAG TPA: hypothetical protein VII06_16465 [Chloroflexota bacterium]|jgi:NitT/TauT family transport system permease protein
MTRRARARVLSVALVVLWLLFWEFSIRWGLLDDRFFMPPSTILNQFAAMLLYDNLAAHISISVQRLIVGYLLGVIPALLVGLLLRRNALLGVGCGPLLVILASFPALAMYPVIMLIFGLGEWSKWIVVAVSTFSTMLYWTQSRLARRPDVGGDVAAGSIGETLGAGGVPQSMWATSLFTGLKFAVWIALLTLMPAEFVGAKSGIGRVIWLAWQEFHVEAMYVGIALAGVVGALAWLAVDLVERLVGAVATRRAGGVT